MGRGVVSHVGSKIGYAGYTQDAYVPTVSHVRHRVYKSDLGRWLQRDPAGYVDGPSLYEYAMGAPVRFVDPWGLMVSGGAGGGPMATPTCGPQPAPKWNPEVVPWHPGHMDHALELMMCLSRCESVHGNRLDQIFQQMLNVEWLQFVNQCPEFNSPYSITYLYYNATNSWHHRGLPAVASIDAISALDQAGVAWAHAGIKAAYGQGAANVMGGLASAGVLYDGSAAEIAAKRAALAKKWATRGSAVIGAAVTIGDTLYFWVHDEKANAVGAASAGGLSLLGGMVVGLKAGAFAGGVAGAAIGMSAGAFSAWLQVELPRRRIATHQRDADRQLCSHLDDLFWRYMNLAVNESDALDRCKNGCYKDFLVK